MPGKVYSNKIMYKIFMYYIYMYKYIMYMCICIYEYIDIYM